MRYAAQISIGLFLGASIYWNFKKCFRTRNSNQQPVGVPLQMYREPLQVIGPLSVIGPIPKPFSEFFKF